MKHQINDIDDIDFFMIPRPHIKRIIVLVIVHQLQQTKHHHIIEIQKIVVYVEVIIVMMNIVDNQIHQHQLQTQIKTTTNVSNPKKSIIQLQLHNHQM